MDEDHPTEQNPVPSNEEALRELCKLIGLSVDEVELLYEFLYDLLGLPRSTSKEELIQEAVRRYSRLSRLAKELMDELRIENDLRKTTKENLLILLIHKPESEEVERDRLREIIQDTSDTLHSDEQDATVWDFWESNFPEGPL